MEEIQTSEETLPEETSTETEGEQTPPVDYEAKFAASTKEAQRLLNETKRLESEAGEERATRQRLETELKSYYDTLKEQNPEAFDLNSVKNSLNDIQKRIAVREETEELNTFVNSNPEAGSHREALKALGRSMPKTPYNTIWDKYFKPLVEKGEEEYAKNLQIKKRTQPETGKGTVTEEPAEMSKAEFNALSLDKQRAYLKKAGVKFEGELQI